MTTSWLAGARKYDLHPAIGNGPFGKFLGVVLHVNVDESGTPHTFWGNGNPGQVCPNFQVFKDGTIDQMLPFNWQPWCLPLDVTEVLTPNGWLPLAKVNVSTEIASWSADSGALRFARPLAIIEPYESNTMHVADIECTPDHRLYYWDSRGALKVDTADEVAERHLNRIPTCGQLSTPGMGVGPDLMRLLVWAQADGSYKRAKNGNLLALTFHFAKQRKVARVCEVLDQLGKDYSVTATTQGTTRIQVYGKDWLAANVEKWLPNKHWTWELLDASADEFAALDEEIVLADGSATSQRTYSTGSRQNADVIQALYVTHGRSVAVAVHPTPAGKLHYGVVLHARRHRGRMVNKSYRIGRETALVGCLTTVDDTILIRQRGHVRVVGNCQVDGNFNYAAIETAGMPNEALTVAQEASIAKILAVYRSDYGMKMAVANSPGVAGFGIHSMGGAAWGGHSCPGTIRANQRQHILDLATGKADDDMDAAEMTAWAKSHDGQQALGEAAWTYGLVNGAFGPKPIQAGTFLSNADKYAQQAAQNTASLDPAKFAAAVAAKMPGVTAAALQSAFSAVLDETTLQVGK